MAAPAANAALPSDEDDSDYDSDEGVAPVEDGADIDPPPRALLALPPRIASAQRVVDLVAAAAAATDPRAPPGDADNGRILALARALGAFRLQASRQLSPIQYMWQHGEFIHLALAANQLAMAIHIAWTIVQALPNDASVDAGLFSAPDRKLYLGSGTNIGGERMRAVALPDANPLLLLAYYMPLCPDLAGSLDLLKRVVRASAQPSRISPLWVSTILQCEGGQFYVDRLPARISTWFHAMRRDHTLAAAKWLLGPERPLPLQLGEEIGLDSIHSVRFLAYIPAAIRDVIWDAILHTQSRDTIMRARAQFARDGYSASGTMRAIDQHLQVHVPDTATLDAAQEQVMGDLVEQMTRASGGSLPHELAGLVMDYTRRETTRAEAAAVSSSSSSSTLTPYQQREAVFLRQRVAQTQIAMADERVAAAATAAAPRPIPAHSRARPHIEAREDEEEEEEEKEQKRARTGGRGPIAPVPALEW